MSNYDYDVVVVGYGPTGQMVAAQLGVRGCKVGAFERYPGLYSLPRAGHVDHEIMRQLQSIGAVDRFLKDAFRMTKYYWRNAKGETLLTFDWDALGISGWASDYLLYQPHPEDALNASVSSEESVDVHHGWLATGIVQDADGVTLTLRRSKPDATETKTVRARYLIGADGANSFVRTALGIDQDDYGFNENWLVVDLRPKRVVHFEFDNGQICDPARPMCLFQLGKTHRRFEFMMMPGETREHLEKPETVWKLIKPWMAPDDADLIRNVVYTFRSSMATRWRDRRIFLAGDSAHLMPPFMGQGMCSGLRDAVNLSWKLDAVLRGVAEDALLDSYEAERKPHVKVVIDLSTEVGRISCITDPEAAAARDAAFLSGKVSPPPPFPWLQEGLLSAAADGAAVTGRLGPQGRIVSGGRKGLADDVVGRGHWQLISRTDLLGHLPSDLTSLLSSLGTVAISLDEVEDSDGIYGAYLDANGLEAVLVRPDFYVYGASASQAGMRMVLKELHAYIGASRTASEKVA
ncbi:MAG: bifunctional 3-(3-hydroxy-phenyl)propionate/3-hydroxycinnamic acid hydroxylase [Mesorhizobium sp.]|uniref:bifunctional 3-(3-hydroxy-phenyl)propionate/3-hydroxycinnamic acid hydroxylase MhpA n=1 Tax=Mesorhizobium sp. TaxID=1871066 RepID=UPI000FE76ED9|nr:bifunctional 3-(3-hydroxy-phenyl)propionate/3-hydroxycinnamic acid hydroxylase [Mesorhizobium sp.]RWI57063.1 MAG: bifunctional 3-(3-hydroxy-phenyl)propionate/3-hydroxycinnamic acid hydroxylase [Mesorhizobium sp.]